MTNPENKRVFPGPNLKVKMPVTGVPARLVLIFAHIIEQFPGGNVTVTPEETRFVERVRMLVSAKMVSREALIAEYLESMSDCLQAHGMLTASLDGGSVEFSLLRAECKFALCIVSRKDGPEFILRLEGAAGQLQLLEQSTGALKKLISRRLWTTDKGSRQADFRASLLYWIGEALMADLMETPSV